MTITEPTRPMQQWENSIVPAPQSSALVPVDPRASTQMQPYVAPPQGYYMPHPGYVPQPQPQPAPAPAPAAETVVSVADLIGYLRNYGRWGIIAAIPLAALCFYFLGFGKKVYEAEAMLQIYMQENTLLKLDKNAGGGLSELSAVQIVNNHRTGLKTRRFVDYLYNRLSKEERDRYVAGMGVMGLKGRLLVAVGLKDLPKAIPPEELFATKLDDLVRIEPVKESHVLRVIVKDGDPQQAALLANHYVQDYIDFIADNSIADATSAYNQLNQKGDEAKARLDEKEAELAEFNRKADLLKNGDANDNSTMRAENLERRRSEVEVELLKAQERVRQLRDAESQGRDLAGIRGLGDDSQIVEIQKKLNDAKSKRDTLLEWCGSRHPKLLQSLREITRLEAENISRIKAIAEASETEESRLESELKRLSEILAGARGQAFEQGPNRIRQKQLRDEVEGLRTLHTEISQAQDRARMAKELRSNGNLEVKDVAVAPEDPISPKKSLALVASMMVFGLVGLGVPVGMGLSVDHVLPMLRTAARESKAKTLAKASGEPAVSPAPAPQPAPVMPPLAPPAPVSPFMQIPAPSAPQPMHLFDPNSTQVLASLPELMAGEGPVQLSELLHPSPLTGGNAISQISAILERQRTLRRGTGVILITSAYVGEGKSLLASALSAALCTSGRSVFLMECNPAAPGIENWFPQAIACSAWTNDLEALRYGQSNLFLLPAHDLPSYEMSDLLDGYRAWMARAQAQQIDWIILDGASLLRGFADVAQLAPNATDILFVHDSTISSPDQVKAALNLLRPLATQDQMRGMVLNRTTTCMT